MKTLITLAKPVKPSFPQPMLALAFATMVSSMAWTPALADNHDNHQGNWDNGRGNGGYNHGKGKGHGYYDNRHGYQQPYYNQRPPPRNAYPYGLPPVYYPPVPSPGINLVFPIGIH